MPRVLSLLAVIGWLALSSAGFAADMSKKGRKARPAKAKEESKGGPVSGEAFFTPNGKKYHTSDKCTFLARSKKIERTTRAEAEKKGLTLCMACADNGTQAGSKSTKKEPAAPPKDGQSEEEMEKGSAPVPNAEVFFSPTSKKYHTHRQCTFLARSKEIQTATRAEAEKKGLSACKTCTGQPSQKRSSRRKSKMDEDSSKSSKK